MTHQHLQEMMMQRLNAVTAKAIVDTSNTLLPIVYRRDWAYSHACNHQTEIAATYASIRNAERLNREATTDEGREEARDALLKATDQLEDHKKHAAEAQAAAKDAILLLKKLTHKDKERAAMRLPPRRERRAATRFVEREKRRLAREKADGVRVAAPPQVSMRTSSGA